MQFVIIILLALLPGMQLDLITPTFPSIQYELAISSFMVQWLISINFLAQGICALVAGNLSDKYGYKPVVLSGLSIFLLGTVVIVYGKSFYILLAGRLLQGIGVSAPAILCYQILANIFSKEEQVKKMAMLNGVYSLILITAPIISSYINRHLSWRYNFYILGFTASLCIVLTQIFIKNSDKNDSISLSLKEYFPLIKSKHILLSVAAACSLSIGATTLSSALPILFINIYGISTKSYGYYISTLVVVSTIVNFVSVAFIKHFGEKKCFYISILLLILFAIITIIMVILQIHNPYTIIAVTTLFSAGVVIPTNILLPYILNIDLDASGKLSALFKMMKLFLTVLSIQVISSFHQKDYTVLGISMCVIAIASTTLCFILNRKHNIFSKII